MAEKDIRSLQTSIRRATTDLAKINELRASSGLNDFMKDVLFILNDLENRVSTLEGLVNQSRNNHPL